MIQNTADAIKSLDAFLVAPDMPQGCEVLVAKIIASLARVKLDLDEIEARLGADCATCHAAHDRRLDEIEAKLAPGNCSTCGQRIETDPTKCRCACCGHCTQPPASAPAPASQAATTPGAPGAREALVEEMMRAIVEQDEKGYAAKAEAALRVVEARRREPTEEECIEANRVYFERAQEFSGTYIECIRAALRRYEEIIR